MEQLGKEKLSKLEHELSEWRVSNNGKRGREIPPQLRMETVELLSYYSAWFLQKRLGINSGSIKKWEEEYSSSPVFITLPPVKEKKILSENLSLKVSHRNWSLEGNLSLKDWESAIGLLEGVR